MVEHSLIVSGSEVAAKTAAKLGDGDTVTIEAKEEPIEIIFICSEKLGEQIAWLGPIVMNTREELMQASNELKTGEFIKQSAKYENK